MDNFDKWRFYMQYVTSPDSWVNFGWYFLVGAALQRRVWMYDEERPLYPNQYVCLVGPPGLGKGLVLGPVANFLKYHKYEKGQLIKTSIGQELPPLYPVGADSITFEQLLADVGDSSRRIPTPDNRVYMHCSYAFVLEELASLFKHKTADVIKFLQNAYDSKDYEYKTKHQGKDLLRNICFSFIAGTQTDFLKEASESRIFGQGFASRTLFLFESRERFSAFHISEFTDEQRKAKEELLKHIKQLSTLYGRVTYDKDTYKFLEEWYSEIFIPARDKAPHRLQDYYSRKKVIMLKLAMAIHFGEELTMNIPITTFHRAIAMLDAIEPQMSAGLALSGKNELHNSARNMLQFIRLRGRVLKRDILLEFGADLTVEQIETCLKELELGYNLRSKLEEGKMIYYL